MSDSMVFAFNLDAPSLERLEAVCRALDIALRPVDRAAFGLPIGAMLGMPAARLTANPADDGFEEPMLVMCGLEPPKFDEFLRSLRASGIPRIDLKAVVTPTNITWSARRLRDELRQEHDRLHGQRG